jgi:oligoribonuclease (3'-5' exoribonuclease)
MRPYISLDIETAGLDIDSTILEIGLVLDSGDGTPLESLQTLRAHPAFDYIEKANPVALNINRDLLAELAKNPGQPIKQIFPQIEAVFERAGDLAFSWDEANSKAKPSRRVQVAGKNVASFDLPRLRHQFPCLDRLFNKTLQHRTLDVGSMYASRFGYTPSLQEILDLISDNKTVAHTAVEDALDVVRAIRAL